jgi:hypothetical protein
MFIVFSKEFKARRGQFARHANFVNQQKMIKRTDFLTKVMFCQQKTYSQKPACPVRRLAG